MMIAGITQEVLVTVPTQVPLPTQGPTTLDNMMTTTRGTGNILPNYSLPTHE